MFDTCRNEICPLHAGMEPVQSNIRESMQTIGSGFGRVAANFERVSNGEVEK